MLDMPILTTVGALMGCSGAALTKIMCDTMNRDILSVILGGYGTKASGGGEAMKFEGEATTTTVDETCKLLMESESVIIVPGYDTDLSLPRKANTVTKIEYFGTYLRYLPTNPMSPHCDNFPANPRSHPVGSQIPVTPNIAELVCFFPETL